MRETLFFIAIFNIVFQIIFLSSTMVSKTMHLELVIQVWVLAMKYISCPVSCWLKLEIQV